MTRPPGNASAGSGLHPHQGQRPAGLRIAGFTIKLTLGAYLLSLLVIVLGAAGLPALAPGWPAVAYLAATAGLVTGVLASLIAHELAHAVSARRFGQAASEISIGFFGGTSHARGSFATPQAQRRVAAAGLMASFAAALASAGLAWLLAITGAGVLGVFIFSFLAWVNGLLAIANALPGLGTDGGTIIQAWAWGRSGDRARATVTAARAGQYTGALLIVAGVTLLALGYFEGVWAGLMGLLMAGTARAQARQALAITALSGLRVRDVLSQATPAAAVAGWQTVRAFLDGGDAGSGSERAGDRHDGDGVPAGDATASTWAWSPATGAAAYPVRDFDGRAAGLLTSSQLAAVPGDRWDTLRIIDVATPIGNVVTATLDEPMDKLVARLAIRPATPAALHTAGHVLVIDGDGTAAGVLTPADVARASRSGRAHPGWPAP